jgi:hypothetical protein
MTHAPDMDDLEDRILRTLCAKAAQIDAMTPSVRDLPDLPRAPKRRARRTLSRRATLVLAAIGALGVAGATIAFAADAFTRGSGIDGQPTSQQQHQLRSELRDYDPAEVQYLRDQTHGTVDDQGLVGTLEFRRACRETLRAVGEAHASRANNRAPTVDAIMLPEVQRLIDREPVDSRIDRTFARFATEIKNGHTTDVLNWLEGPPPGGNCTDALAWKR